MLNLTRWTVLPCSLLLLSGCLDRDLRPLNPCTISGVAETVKVDNIDNVDLLFMMDNSNSMAQEQIAIAREIPNLVRTLASGDIADPSTGLPDGEQDFPPVRSLHVGVVTSDMGTGGFLVPTCSESNFGDDGVLRSQGNVAISGCMATYPTFLEFRPADGGDPTAFASDVECVAVLGTNGCGFEQQLEATLKALTPSSSSITFGMGTVGHADGANNGFLREDSLLTILMITDEDDCSAIDADLFNPSSTRYAGDLNLRCFQFPEAVHPIERFSAGLLATRQDPDLLVFGAITGIPEDINPSPDAPVDFAGILADDMMQEMVDPTMPTRLRPSCNRPGTGIAFPPRRIVAVAQQLEAQGANAIVQTICQDSYAAAIQAVINKIADVLGGTCLPRSLNRDATGKVNCDVVEVLPPDGATTTCAAIPGREFLRTEVDEDGNSQEICRVTQLTPEQATAGDPGWFYDDTSVDVMTRCPPERPQRISFSQPPATGTLVRLECLQTVGDTGGAVGIGSSCAADCSLANDRRDIIEAFDMGLTCEPISQTCQPQCATDANCAGGYVCYDADGDGQSFCVNPTCASM